MTELRSGHLRKPLPTIDDLTRPFWEAANDERLVVQRCDACGELQFPPAYRCRACGADAPGWAEVSGRGVVHTFTVFHRAYHLAFADDVPYNVSIIELDEGPHLLSNVVGDRRVAIGDRVQVVFEPVADDIKLPKFEPVDEPREAS